MDLMDLFDRASQWTKTKVGGAAGALDKQTPCDEWTARDLVNHLLVSNRFFQGTARGEGGSPPQGTPEDVMTDDPAADYDSERQETMKAFGADGVLEKMGPTFGIAFVEQLVHGWDLAKATDQDTKMPKDLAEAAFQMIDGRMTDEQRGTFFKSEVKVPADASAQEKLLAYSGRKP